MSINTEDKARIAAEMMFSTQRFPRDMKAVCKELSIQSNLYEADYFKKAVYKDYTSIILTRSDQRNLKSIMQVVAKGGYIENGFGSIGEAIDLMHDLAKEFNISESEIKAYSFAKAYFYEVLTIPEKEQDEILRIDTGLDGPSIFK